MKVLSELKGVTRLCVFLTLALLIILIPKAHSLRSGPVRAKLQTNAEVTFHTILQRLAEKYKVPILAEGTPLRMSINEDDFLNLWLTNDSATKVISGAATLFDYRVVPYGKAYILVKRYTDPFDLPEVSLKELEAATRDAIKILDMVSPPVDKQTLASNRASRAHYYYARQVFRSLSEEQRRILQASPNGVIPFKDLRPEQQGFLQRIALHGDFGQHRDSAEGLLRWFERIPDVTITRETPDLKKPVGFRVKYTEKSGRIIDAFLPMFANRLPIQDTDPSATYLRASKALASWQQQRLPGTITYAELARKINDRAAKADSAVFSVDPVIAGKHITLMGTTGMPDVELFRAAATLHGLLVRQSRKGFYEMTRPRRKIPDNMVDFATISAAIRAVIPDALARALHYGEIDKAETMEARLRRGERPLTNNDSVPAPGDQLDEGRLRIQPGRIALTAITMLRILTETKLLPQPDSLPIPVVQLSQPGECFLANYGITSNGFLNAVALRRSSSPLYVDMLKSCGLRCVASPKNIAVSVRHLNNDGTLGTTMLSMTIPNFENQ